MSTHVPPAPWWNPPERRPLPVDAAAAACPHPRESLERVDPQAGTWLCNRCRETIQR
jgi:hypothetical protein